MCHVQCMCGARIALVNKTDTGSAFILLTIQWSECDEEYSKSILTSTALLPFLTFLGSEEGNVIALNPKTSCKIYCLMYFWLPKVSSG